MPGGRPVSGPHHGQQPAGRCTIGDGGWDVGLGLEGLGQLKRKVQHLGEEWGEEVPSVRAGAGAGGRL